MGKIVYDRAIIERFASKLYAKARTIVVLYTFIGFVMASVVGGVGKAGLELSDLALLIIVMIGLIIGYLVGAARAFAFRLQAQMALCQAQIERNTTSALAHGPR